LFTLEKKNLERRLDECVDQARAARDGGKKFFQIYFPDDDATAEDRRHGEYETSRAVEALEPLGWTLENIGQVSEPPDPAYARIERPATRVVGAIYTFRRS
jgi:hypothetical protein